MYFDVGIDTFRYILLQCIWKKIMKKPTSFARAKRVHESSFQRSFQMIILWLSITGVSKPTYTKPLFIINVQNQKFNTPYHLKMCKCVNCLSFTYFDYSYGYLWYFCYQKKLQHYREEKYICFYLGKEYIWILKQCNFIWFKLSLDSYWIHRRESWFITVKNLNLYTKLILR